MGLLDKVKGDPDKANAGTTAQASSEGCATLASLACMALQSGCLAEYVWIDGSNRVRSKARTLKVPPKCAKDLPDWTYDGSSTGQDFDQTSDVTLKPQAIYGDPFRGKPHILVMCDTYTPRGCPLATNHRHACSLAMLQAKDVEPWFGLEQQYFLSASSYPSSSSITHPTVQRSHYCGVGAAMHGRAVADAHYKACMYAGIKISGVNGEVVRGQWEFQVGPASGIEQGDMLWMARYLLHRVAELGGYHVDFEPRADCHGCHCNFSTKPMRQPGGYHNFIVPALLKLAHKHHKHMAAYGLPSEEPPPPFTWGVADRMASCRVGDDVAQKGYGYFEDRRPRGNADPYVVTRMLVQTCCLDPDSDSDADGDGGDDGGDDDDRNEV